MIFDKKYYDDIWETVHRHDYCESLASNLLQKYPEMKSFLDIGTGCGYLVKVLRDKGIDAWGLEVSEYAVENSHGNVRLGDVRDIPFGKQFDVVYSQGLWEYIPEEDIEKAWSECKRVGKIQEHNIDTTNDTSEWSKDFVTHKSSEWWKNKFYPKILVGCSTNEVKSYSLQRWINNVKKFTYPNIEFLVVDTSETDEYISKYYGQLPIERLPQFYPQESQRMCEGMEYIRQHFLKSDCQRWFSVESDILPPPDALEIMLEVGKDADWISHAFPLRFQDQNVEVEQGIGCSILSRKLLEENSWAGFDKSPDGHLWELVRPTHKYKVLEMWGYFYNQHLGE